MYHYRQREACGFYGQWTALANAMRRKAGMNTIVGPGNEFNSDCAREADVAFQTVRMPKETVKYQDLLDRYNEIRESSKERIASSLKQYQQRVDEGLQKHFIDVRLEQSTITLSIDGTERNSFQFAHKADARKFVRSVSSMH